MLSHLKFERHFKLFNITLDLNIKECKKSIELEHFILTRLKIRENSTLLFPEKNIENPVQEVLNFFYN